MSDNAVERVQKWLDHRTGFPDDAPTERDSSFPVTYGDIRAVVVEHAQLYEALKEIYEALEGARAANPEASIEFFEELVEIEPGFGQRMRAALAKARGGTA